MKTIEERQKTDRERQERYRKRQAEMGKKTITATISPEAYQALSTIKKRKGGTNSSIVEEALLSLEKDQQK